MDQPKKIKHDVSFQDDEINQQSQLAEKLKQQMLDQDEVKYAIKFFFAKFFYDCLL